MIYPFLMANHYENLEWSPEPNEKQSNDTPEEDQSADETQNMAHEAIIKRDLEVCEGIENEDQKNVCKDDVLRQKAIGEADPSFCEHMSTQNKRGECEDIVSMIMAEMHNDVKYCSGVMVFPSISGTRSKPDGSRCNVKPRSLTI